MGLTNIQWCDYTFNPWMGCRKVSPECENCYIVTTPPFRFRGLKHGSVRVRTAESTWENPLAWNRKAGAFPWRCPACDCAITEFAYESDPSRFCSNCQQAALIPHRPRVFCLSLGDWLDDENVPIEWLADLLKLIHDTPNLDWLLLTKRPQNWERRLRDVQSLIGPHRGVPEIIGMVADWRHGVKPPANVWIGVSAGADQKAALEIPSLVHFLSCEPLLHALDTTYAYRFDWIIFGGESGKKARQCAVEWIRDGLAFCRTHGLRAFVKQLGANSTMLDPYLKVIRGGQPSPLPLELKDSHGGNMEEWPEDLCVREFPEPGT